MSQIDTVGTYKAKIVEHDLGTTKNGFPQFVARFVATMKWVDDPEGMKHFNLAEPAWVDWSSFNEEITGYLVLFKSADMFDQSTMLLNYEQLQIALGWDGGSFDALTGSHNKDKEVQIRVAENNYNEKVTLQVNWIDAADADPVRHLKGVSEDVLKTLNSKLVIQKVAKKPAAAPAKAPTKPAAAKPNPSSAAPAADPSTTAPAGPVTPSATAPTASPAPSKPGRKAKTAPPAAKPVTPPPPPTPAPDPATAGLPKTCTQEEAWEHVNEQKGDNDDKTVADAWIDACTEVLAGREESQATGEDWAKIRDVVVKDLAL